LPRLWPKQNEPVRLPPPTDIVYALTDVAKGGRLVHKGDPLPRDHVMVRELAEAFEVRCPADRGGERWLSIPTAIRDGNNTR
jgi:hypothetical protein